MHNAYIHGVVSLTAHMFPRHTPLSPVLAREQAVPSRTYVDKEWTTGVVAVSLTQSRRLQPSFPVKCMMTRCLFFMTGLERIKVKYTQSMISLQCSCLMRRVQV